MQKSKNQTKKALGKRIQKLRKKELNISQERFAEQLGISRSYMGFIEQGSAYPSLKLLMKIARKLHVEVEDLFHR